MIKNIDSNIQDSKVLESFFEFITHCKINNEVNECTKSCLKTSRNIPPSSWLSNIRIIILTYKIFVLNTF